MTAKDFGILLETRRARYLSQRDQIALLAGLDTVALMKRRVINQRRNADGGVFGIYSSQYQQNRIENNLLGTEVNFSYTNKMWNSTTARLLSSNDREIVVLISPDKENIQKMIFNTERFGTILELNDEEEGIYRDIYAEKLRDI